MQLYVVSAVCNVALWQAVFWSLAPKVNLWIFPSYKRLEKKLRLEMNRNVSSTTCSIILSLLSWYVFFCRPEVSPTHVEMDQPIVRLTVSIFLGHTVSEILAMAYQGTLLEEKAMLCHHVSSLFSGYVGVMRDGFPYFVVLFLMSELSTPFVSLRESLYFTGKVKSKAYTLNGYVMVVTFFLGRIAIIPHYWYHMYPHVVSGKIFQVGWDSAVTGIFLWTVLNVLNIYWFYRMLRGALKHLVNKKS
ncbi:TMEM56 [Branchiostoma lanceolatum]|uniref:TMEM56 protein n=1 Tax=Branchiostoma lanceolatum TaxID=7740 RepID=A0A8J9YT50_BRALA|nr:TMEM56 [Branchiostoma lanceolatum]